MGESERENGCLVGGWVIGVCCGCVVGVWDDSAGEQDQMHPATSFWLLWEVRIFISLISSHKITFIQINF